MRAGTSPKSVAPIATRCPPYMFALCWDFVARPLPPVVPIPSCSPLFCPRHCCSLFVLLRRCSLLAIWLRGRCPTLSPPHVCSVCCSSCVLVVSLWMSLLFHVGCPFGCPIGCPFGFICVFLAIVRGCFLWIVMCVSCLVLFSCSCLLSVVFPCCCPVCVPFRVPFVYVCVLDALVSCLVFLRASF